MRFILLSCSLDPNSRSRLLAREAERILKAAGQETTFIDLRERPLPPFDNDAVFRDPNFVYIHRKIREADGVLLAVSIYNWGIGSAAKNLIEATGATGEQGARAAWFDKLVTFLCSGGLPHSYMAYSGLAMSLMLDFKCVINPYMVYATGRDWGEASGLSEPLRRRLDKTLRVKLELAERLRGRGYSSDWEI